MAIQRRVEGSSPDVPIFLKAVLSGHESGDGFPLLLLHGGPGLSDYMDSLDSEIEGWRAIHYQQRGLAPSSIDGPFSVARHVADAIAVLDELGVQRAALLGHSWGSHLALQIGVAHPDRVAGMVLVDPPGPSGDGALVEFAEELESVDLPAVFVLGAESPLAPRNGQQNAALMPDAEVDIVAGAGHLPWVEAPGCVAAALSRLQKKLRET